MLIGSLYQDGTARPKTLKHSLHNKFGDIRPINDNGLMQIVDAPTRLDNTLDLVTTNQPNQINRTDTLPSITDHDVVYTELDINQLRYIRLHDRFHCTTKLTGLTSVCLFLSLQRVLSTKHTRLQLKSCGNLAQITYMRAFSRPFHIKL